MITPIYSCRISARGRGGLGSHDPGWRPAPTRRTLSSWIAYRITSTIDSRDVLLSGATHPPALVTSSAYASSPNAQRALA